MWQIKEDIFIFHFTFFFILVMHGSPVSRNGGFSGGRSKDYKISIQKDIFENE